MTTEQAIKELKSDRELYGSKIVYAGDGTPEGDLMLALDMGIAALEKQIPKKVTKSACPSCNRIFLFRHSEKRKGDYCDNCGQALDWSDNNA